MKRIGLLPGVQIWIDDAGYARARGSTLEEALAYAEDHWLVEHKATDARYQDVQGWAALGLPD